MITDTEVLRGFAKQNNRPVSRASLARVLEVDDDAELAGPLARLVREELLRRWCHGTSWMYCLTPAGTRAAGMPALPEPPPAEPATPPPPLPPLDLNDHAPAQPIQEAPPMKADTTDQRATILKVVRELAQWLTTKNVAASCGVPEKTVRRVLNELATEGAIQTIGATSDRRFGRKGLPAPDAKGAREAKPKAAAKKQPAVRGRPRQTHAPARGDALAAGAPIAAFSSKGEIVLTSANGTKVLDVAESREVIGLVRAFDKAGLLAESR